MHAASALAIIALAGQAVALPQWGNWGNGFWNHGGNNNNDDSSNDVAVVTAYTTVTYGGSWSKPTATPQQNQPQQTWAPVASAQPTAAPAPSTGGSTDGYMGVVSEWRSKMGLSALTQDDKLQANAQKTVNDGNGQMVHELNPGSMAQVLAPGDASDFESVFVGGWLCEIPSLPGLDGICNTMSAGWAYGGETGHADILKSGSYSKIGCALADGIWGCDLA